MYTIHIVTIVRNGEATIRRAGKVSQFSAETAENR
jgi:hypothetical protein